MGCGIWQSILPSTAVLSYKPPPLVVPRWWPRRRASLLWQPRLPPAIMMVGQCLMASSGNLKQSSPITAVCPQGAHCP